MDLLLINLNGKNSTIINRKVPKTNTLNSNRVIPWIQTGFMNG